MPIELILVVDFLEGDLPVLALSMAFARGSASIFSLKVKNLPKGCTPESLVVGVVEFSSTEEIWLLW